MAQLSTAGLFGPTSQKDMLLSKFLLEKGQDLDLPSRTGFASSSFPGARRLEGSFFANVREDVVIYNDGTVEDALHILADAMNYLDRTYCRGSILVWIGSTPEGAAYAILRRLLTELSEGPVRGKRNHPPAA